MINNVDPMVPTGSIPLSIAPDARTFDGLSSEEASRLLVQHGLNEPSSARQRSTIVVLLLLFANPLAIVLLIAAGFSAFLGQLVDSAIIVVMVVVGILVNFFQTYHSERAFQAASL